MSNNEPIRVAHIIGKYVGGGVESVVMNYYRHIDHSKIQFDFICDSDSTNIPYEEIEKMGGKVILVPPYQKMIQYHKELKKVLKVGNYKIVHSHINTLSVFSLFAAKCAGVKNRIAHSHSTIINDRREFMRNVIKNILKRFSKMFATHYFACSDLAAISQFGKKAFDKSKITIINNAIDLNKFKLDEKSGKEKRKELKINDDTLVVGHVGRFVETKNHSFLLDIFKIIHDSNSNSVLLLAGDGPLIENIKNKAILLGIENNVIFLGQRNDVNELYQVFDVFILPSLYEGLPVVGVEAQASSCFCVFTKNMTKNAKIIDSTIFKDIKESPDSWASVIINELPNLKKHNTKDEISKYGFNIEEEAKKLMKYYFEMLENK